MDLESVKSEFKDTMAFVLPKLPLIIALNVVLITQIYFMFSDDVKKEREFAIEGLKAIAWSVTTPECQQKGFCYKIESDQDAGKLESITVVSQSGAFTNGSSVVATSSGIFHIQGNPSINHSQGEEVKLYAKKGSMQNVLCIGSTCYLVPFLKD